MSAASKEEFEDVYKRFVNPKLTERPIVFEVFTKVEDENEALLLVESFGQVENKKCLVKSIAKKILGEEGKKIFDVIRDR